MTASPSHPKYLQLSAADPQTALPHERPKVTQTECRAEQGRQKASWRWRFKQDSCPGTALVPWDTPVSPAPSLLSPLTGFQKMSPSLQGLDTLLPPCLCFLFPVVIYSLPNTIPNEGNSEHHLPHILSEVQYFMTTSKEPRYPTLYQKSKLIHTARCFPAWQ